MLQIPGAKKLTLFNVRTTVEAVPVVKLASSQFFQPPQGPSLKLSCRFFLEALGNLTRRPWPPSLWSSCSDGIQPPGGVTQAAVLSMEAQHNSTVCFRAAAVPLLCPPGCPVSLGLQPWKLSL